MKQTTINELIEDLTGTLKVIAYARFMHILDNNPSCEDIAEECENILMDCLEEE